MAKMEEGCAYYAWRLQFTNPNPRFANRIEGGIAAKRLLVKLYETGRCCKANREARPGERLFARLDGDPDTPMPTFGGAGCFNRTKILKCKDDLSQSGILLILKAKVRVPRTVKPEDALWPLRRQNADVPTEDCRSPTTARRMVVKTTYFKKSSRARVYYTKSSDTW